MSKAENPIGRQAATNPPQRIVIVRLPDTLKRRGRSRSSHYADIKAGLFVKPVRIGSRSVGTPDNEIEVLNSARIAGKSDDEIRLLVRQLESARRSGSAGGGRS